MENGGFSLHQNQICHHNAHQIPAFAKSSVDVEVRMHEVS